MPMGATLALCPKDRGFIRKFAGTKLRSSVPHGHIAPLPGTLVGSTGFYSGTRGAFVPAEGGKNLCAGLWAGEGFAKSSYNVPIVYEMRWIAHFTYIQNSMSGVISLFYNELALPVQRIYATANLRDCGCDCNIHKKVL
jgi:hypothetical protein